MAARKTATAVDERTLTNDGAFEIDLEAPYSVDVTIEGTTSIIFHRFSVERYEAAREAKKGSRARSEDDPDSYLFRTEDGDCALPAEHLYRSMVKAAKRYKDPNNPRASAMELFKAGVIVSPEFASLGKTAPDYVDQRRAVVQRAAIPRLRPAFLAGWQAEFTLDVGMPEILPPVMVSEVLRAAGRFCGLAEMRPTYGRFHVIRFDVQ